jgi:hypothetical protein
MAQNNDRSPLWTAAAGAGLAGGIGYGLYKHWDDFAQAFNSSTTGTNSLIANYVDLSARFNVSLDSSVAKEIIANELAESNLLTYVKRTERGSGINAQVKAFAYEAIMSGGQATHEEALEALKAIDVSNLDTPDLYKIAMKSVEDAGGTPNLLNQRITELHKTVPGLPNTPTISSPKFVSQGGLGTSFITDVLPSELSEPANAQMSRIKQEFATAAGGKKFNLTYSSYLREDLIDDKVIKTPMLIAKSSGQTIAEIALEDTGFTYSGDHLQNRYVPLKGYRAASGDVISHQEFYTRKITDAINAATSESDLNARARELRESFFNQLDDVNVSSLGIYTTPLRTSGTVARNNLLNTIAVPYDEVSQADIERLIKSGKLYPGTSPSQAGKGILNTTNIAEDLFGSCSSVRLVNGLIQLHGAVRMST